MMKKAFLSGLMVAFFFSSHAHATGDEKSDVSDFARLAVSEIMTLDPDSGVSEKSLALFQGEKERSDFLTALEDSGMSEYLSDHEYVLIAKDVSVDDLSSLDYGQAGWEASGSMRLSYEGEGGQEKRHEMMEFKIIISGDFQERAVQSISLKRLKS